jgi:hypothetical protein
MAMALATIAILVAAGPHSVLDGGSRARDDNRVQLPPSGVDPCELSAGGSVFLTGHDPDFHAFVGGNAVGAQNINIAAINFVMDPAFNPFVASGIDKFLFVESKGGVPGGHVNGVNGIIASGYVMGLDFDHHDFNTLDAALDQLGTAYSAIVVASDYGGILRQAELDVLTARSPDIIAFLNAGGGLYAMAESNSGAGLTPNGGHYGFLPFVVSSTQFNQAEEGNTVTPFGASLGLTNGDVNGNFSHNIFLGTEGLGVVDVDSEGNILSLAGRGIIDPDIGILTDCNGNGVSDACDVDPADPDGNGEVSEDCNDNGIPDECDILLDCPTVEVVFVMDTSVSMNDEGAALCNDIGLVVSSLEASGIEVEAQLLAITSPSSGCGLYSCLTDTVASLFGTAVPDDPPPGVETLGDCPPFPQVPCEDGGRATAIVAGLKPWMPDTIRVIVPLADEGPWCGNPVTSPDNLSIDHAIDVALTHGVIVSPITGSGSSSAVVGLAQQIADATGGLQFSSVDPATDLALAIENLVLDACTTAGDCNDNGVPDDCDIADGTSEDCNDNGVPDECDIESGESEDANGDGIPDECLVILDLDIKPGSCPNSFNSRSRGVLPVGLLGQADLDITMVDVSSIMLSRADGVGGSVTPHEGPPGPHSVLDDVGTPFEGEPCNCHELEGDGFTDLSMKFDRPELVEALELESAEPGAFIELVVTGVLTNGQLFEASDCIRLVPPFMPPVTSESRLRQRGATQDGRVKTLEPR